MLGYETIWKCCFGRVSLQVSQSVVLTIGIVYRIDLDIENGSPTGYGTFVEKIRCFASDAEKKLVDFYLVAEGTATDRCLTSLDGLGRSTEKD